MRKVIDLFPTPLVMCKGVLGPELVERLRERALATQMDSNVRTDLLSHTEMIDPRHEDIFGIRAGPRSGRLGHRASA